MNEIGSEDEDAAEEWVMKMLDEPHIHRAGLERWMAVSPDRRALFEDLMRDVDDASAAAATMPRPQARVPRSWKWSAALAAALVGFLVLSVYTLWFSPDMLGSDTSFSSGTAKVIATRVGEVRTVTLADGSSVTLDTNSLLTIDYSPQNRSLDLRRGRARFAVAHDRDRPFIVHAGRGEVLATGTVFDVFLDDAVRVNLLEGSVKVTAPVRSGAKSIIRNVQLHAGQQTSFDGTPALALVAKSAQSSARQWTERTRSLDDVPIREVIAEANRYSDTQIALADPALGDRRIFGDLDVRDVERVAGASAAYLGLEVDRTRPGTLLLRAKK